MLRTEQVSTESFSVQIGRLDSACQPQVSNFSVLRLNQTNISTRGVATWMRATRIERGRQTDRPTDTEIAMLSLRESNKGASQRRRQFCAAIHAPADFQVHLRQRRLQSDSDRTLRFQLRGLKTQHGNCCASISINVQGKGPIAVWRETIGMWPKIVKGQELRPIHTASWNSSFSAVKCTHKSNRIWTEFIKKYQVSSHLREICEKFFSLREKSTQPRKLQVWIGFHGIFHTNAWLRVYFDARLPHQLFVLNSSGG